MFYHPASNQHIREGNPFTIDGVQYPSQWLNHSTPQDKEALGLVEVTTVGTREDDRLYYVTEELVGAELRITNSRKSDEQIMSIMLQRYTAALEAHYDSKAQERKYDNRYTCSLRAGYAGPFQAEGTAFAVWMDACNAQCYTMLAQVQAGTIPLPTIEEVISALPELTWPSSTP